MVVQVFDDEAPHKDHTCRFGGMGQNGTDLFSAMREIQWQGYQHVSLYPSYS